MSIDRPTPTDPVPAQERTEALGPGSVCLGCTYDLTGLMPCGQCPECGKPIAESLSGDLLAFADAEWLRRTHRGLKRVTWAVLLPVLFASLSIIGAVPLLVVSDQFPLNKALNSFLDALLTVLFWINVAVFAVAPFVGLHGWFTATSQEPGRFDVKADRVRLWVRWTAVAWLVVTVMSLTGMSISATVNTWLGTAGLWVAWGVHATASSLHYWHAMTFVRTLANRVPAPRLVRKTTTERLTLVIGTTLGVLACGVGPIVAFIMYISVIDRARGHLRSVLARRESNTKPHAGPS